MQNTVSVNGLRKVYGKVTALDGVSFDVQAGEIFGLLGPNGAGKTTTFYIATGLVQPEEGTVKLNERNITTLALHQRARLGMGYLTQQASIFRNLSVRDNILLVLEQTGIPRPARPVRLAQLLREFRLEKVANTLGSLVSGGERRRTELARALAAGLDGPKYLLLDEPFAGVDPIAVGEMQEIIAQLRERQMGILITDHNFRETLAITDRAYVMRNGQILASGTAEELYDNPLVKQYYLGDNFQK